MKCHIDTLKPKRFIPNGFVEQRHEDLDLVFYVSPDDVETASAICYEGRRLKPSFHYRYRSAERRAEAIANCVDSRQKRHESKLKLQQERKAFKTTLVVGDILSTSWGYEQTNVEFFQVIKVKSAKRIVIREVSKMLTQDDDAHDCGTVVPSKDSFIGDEIEKTVTIGESVKFESYRRASKWDGRPMYCSWYY